MVEKLIGYLVRQAVKVLVKHKPQYLNPFHFGNVNQDITIRMTHIGPHNLEMDVSFHASKGLHFNNMIDKMCKLYEQYTARYPNGYPLDKKNNKNVTYH